MGCKPFYVDFKHCMKYIKSRGVTMHSCHDLIQFTILNSPYDTTAILWILPKSLLALCHWLYIFKIMYAFFTGKIRHQQIFPHCIIIHHIQYIILLSKLSFFLTQYLRAFQSLPLLMHFHKKKPSKTPWIIIIFKLNMRHGDLNEGCVVTLSGMGERF